jgi:hypothetical protein
MVEGFPHIHHLTDPKTSQHKEEEGKKKGVWLSTTCSSYSLTSLAKPAISKSHEKLQTSFINSTVLVFRKTSAHHIVGLINLQHTTQRKKTPISTTLETVD